MLELGAEVQSFVADMGEDLACALRASQDSLVRPAPITAAEPLPDDLRQALEAINRLS